MSLRRLVRYLLGRRPLGGAPGTSQVLIAGARVSTPGAPETAVADAARSVARRWSPALLVATQGEIALVVPLMAAVSPARVADELATELRARGIPAVVVPPPRTRSNPAASSRVVTWPGEDKVWRVRIS